MLSVAEVAALAIAPNELSAAITRAGCARITLCERRDVWCLVDAEDYEWLSAWRWNIGWHAKTPWKFYAKRNVGPARLTVYLHREVLVRSSGCDEDFASRYDGHHVNGQSLDCRRDNLEWATPSRNRSIRLKRAAVPSLESIVAGLAGKARDDEVPF